LGHGLSKRFHGTGRRGFEELEVEVEDRLNLALRQTVVLAFADAKVLSKARA